MISPVIYSEKLSSMSSIADASEARLKWRQNDSSISDNCSIDPPLPVPLTLDTPFRRGHLVGFSAFFDDGEKYHARYCVRRELRLVNRPILFNRLYRVNNRAHLPSIRFSLSSLFFPFIAARFTAGNRWFDTLRKIDVDENWKRKTALR